MRTEDNTHIQF